MKNYIIRQGDMILITDDAVKDYDGNCMFNVYKDERGKYCALSLSGQAYPFPVDSLLFIRTKEGWWEVDATHCDPETLEQFNDVTYDMHHAEIQANYILDFFLTRFEGLELD